MSTSSVCDETEDFGWVGWFEIGEEDVDRTVDEKKEGGEREGGGIEEAKVRKGEGGGKEWSTC